MADRSGKVRILVLGYIVRGPLGGLAWHHLQYVLGLHRLGHDVYFLEDSEDYEVCYDPSTDTLGTDPTYGLRFANNAFARLGLDDRWAYYDAHTGKWLGPCRTRAMELCASADLLVNVSGVNPIREWYAKVPSRVLIDTDPAFMQIRHLSDRGARDLAKRHNVFFSFGENIAAGTSLVPDDGLPWQATRQPVVLDAWTATSGPPEGRFTSVMQWDSYVPLEYAGRRFGMKSESFKPYLDLPRRSEEAFELAVGSPTAPRNDLIAHGWHLLDPRRPTRDPWTYQAYIHGSKAEFGIAKHGYVSSRSGWFSERSCAYLASGRPAVVQDTGFTEWLPTGEGLIAFSSPDEAINAIESISTRYQRHCEAARALAEEHFDSGKVLTRLLEGTQEAVERQDVTEFAPTGESQDSTDENAEIGRA